MARIVIADITSAYDGRDLENRPLGGTESSVIRCARELVRRGHRVVVHTNVRETIEHQGVVWAPIGKTRDKTCDLYVAVQQPKLFSLARNPKRRALWVLWPSSQLRHYKKLWRMWLYRPVPVLESLYQVEHYSCLLPPRRRHIVIPLALPDDVRGQGLRTAVPAARAIFASNPQRNLRGLVEIWAERILPQVESAVLDVFGLHSLGPNDDPWKAWEGSLLPEGLPQRVRDSVRVHPSASRQELIAAMRESRMMLYLGHKCEAFCLSLAEAQALGVPAVIAPVAALPERVMDGVTGFHRSDSEGFAAAAVSLFKDDALWRRQHEAAIRYQQGIPWPQYAALFEGALLGDPNPTATDIS
jgi:hypothetical protein